MSRSRIALALVAAAALSSTVALRADVRSDEKTKFQLAGALGKVVNFFGGKAAREGVTSTVAIKGSRMMTTSGDSTAQIVDLGEEKIYSAEWVSTSQLERQGIDKTTLKPGDNVRIWGSPSKNPSDNRMHLKRIERSDGWEWRGGQGQTR